MTAKKVLTGILVMAACTMFGETKTAPSKVTFNTKGRAKVRWKLKWQAQSLKYPAGAVVEKIKANIKDGMKNNRAKIEFYKNYNNAGKFSGLLGSEVFTIKPNKTAVYTFSTPVELSGAADGIYYLKLSPAEGGVVHGLYQKDDKGNNPLTAGMVYFSNRPKGLGKDADISRLIIYTNPLSEEAAAKAWKAAAKARRALTKNILDFGAKGDGETNDTTAFEKALSGGGNLYVPAGTYILGPKPMNIPKNLVLWGDGRGTVLKPVKGTGVLFKLSSGAQIRNLSIDGKNVKKGGVNDGLIVIRRANGCLIDSVYIKDCNRVAVWTANANDIIIQNCDIRNVWMGIGLVFSNRVKVLGNTVVDAYRHGIQFWGSQGSGKGKEHEKILSEDLIFANNYVKNGGGGAIWGAGGRRVIMTGNIVDGCKDVGLDPEFCEDVTITGNIANNCYNAGISLFYTCKRVSIVGNTVYNNSVPKDKEKSAIFTMLQRKLTKEEMNVPWYVRSGIWLVPPNRAKMATDTGNEDVTIVGNTIYTKRDDGIPRRDIWIGGSVKNVRIEANTLSGQGVYFGDQQANLFRLGKQPLMLPPADTVTFKTRGKRKTRWKLKWQAQGLKYPNGAVVDRIQAVFKDGMKKNRAKIEFYKNYNGAGKFSGLIASKVFTVKPNGWRTFSFSPPVELSGAADGIYYLKLSPAVSGVVHGLYQKGDDGSDPLRHGTGTKGGMAYFSNAPKGLGKDVDMSLLTIHTNPLSKKNNKKK